MRYKLNPIYKLDTTDNLEFNPDFIDESQELKSQPILINSQKGKIYLINHSIFEVLTNFEQPKSLAELQNQYNFNLQDSTEELQPILSKFVKDLIQKKILIREDANQKILEKSFKFNIGDYIDNFKIIELIANKSSVEIYKVINQSNREFAIKLIHPQKFVSVKKYLHAIEHLKKEYEILMKLSTIPQAVSPFQLVDNQDYSYLVMDYISGVSITKWLKDETINYQKKWSLFNQILDLFSQIHSLGIIHGDIHPSNFLIHNHTIHIIDFGLGLRNDIQQNELQRLGGVSNYMPPERIQSHVFNKFKNPSTYQSEIYQLGILFYFILYHRTPFNGLTWKKLSEQIISSEPHFELKLPNGEIISEQWIELIKQMISKDLNQRFKTIEEVMNDFAKIN